MKVCPKCKKSSQLTKVSYPEWISETLDPVVSDGKLLGFDIFNTDEGDSKVFDDIYCPECDYNYGTDSLERAWEEMIEINVNQEGA